MESGREILVGESAWDKNHQVKVLYYMSNQLICTERWRLDGSQSESIKVFNFEIICSRTVSSGGAEQLALVERKHMVWLEQWLTPITLEVGAQGLDGI